MTSREFLRGLSCLLITEKASNYALHARAHSLRSFTAREHRR